MSNHSNKVIGLRPIYVPNSEAKTDQQNFENERLQVKKEVQNLEERKQHTQQWIEASRQQIEKEKKAWEEEKLRWIENAKKEGYNAGFDQGKQDGLLHYQDLIAQAKNIIDMTRNDRMEMITQNERFILNVSLEVATKIIHQSLIEKDAYIEVVKNVILEAKEQPSIQIYAHPDDYQTCQKYRDELFAIVDPKIELSFYPDDSLQIGSCIMVTPIGKIDASVDTQLENLRNQLHALLEEMDSES
ncbi:flagellar assembly protein FliH [Paraliobacillus salinarum]|uniref:flagellar assembly protein FliH n=1 Tax=Paraliobacillus salinarum TaxID=1158996 RepID=UPI0015F667D5|nr:flagellar assembly protein FliH [Paraliobacillus salinarum]